jgi:hypothetical protein
VDGLAVAGMAATGVGPQSRGVVFRQSALLHEELALGIEDKDGESPMQMRADMGGLLLHQSDGMVLLIYQNYIFHFCVLFNYELNELHEILYIG